MFETILCIIIIGIIVIAVVKKVSKGVDKSNYKDYIILDNMPNDFKQVYDKLYEEHILELENMRKKVRIREIFKYICLLLFFIGYFVMDFDGVLFSQTIDMVISLIGFISLILFMVLVFRSRKYKKSYKLSYKKEIVSNFIKLLNPNLEYKPITDNPQQILDYYRSANFDNKTFNKFYCDDYIEGFITDDIYLKMTDVHIRRETGSGKNRHVEEIFQGLFAITKCNKNIGTTVKTSKNKMKILEKKDRVEMDSNEFEEYFDVYSQNKIVAMQILTSDIMEMLLNFYKKYQLAFEIIFENSTIFLRFFTGPMFEPKIFGNSMDKELLFIYFETIKFTTQLTQKVNKVIQDTEI